MKAQDIQTGDYVTGDGINFIVRDRRTQTTLDGLPMVELKLSMGRTDPGDWYAYMADTDLAVYRPTPVHHERSSQ